MPVVHRALDRTPDGTRAFVERDPPGKVDDGHIARVAYGCAGAHEYLYTPIMYNRR